MYKYKNKWHANNALTLIYNRMSKRLTIIIIIAITQLRCTCDINRLDKHAYAQTPRHHVGRARQN